MPHKLSAALEATRVNAELNQITDLELDRRNRIGDVNDSYDVVLIGDLFYDTEIADLLLPWLAALTKTARKTEVRKLRAKVLRSKSKPIYSM